MIKNRFFWLFLGVLVLLAGCGPVSSQRYYTFEPPTSPQGQQCVAQCQQSRQLCQQACQDKKACRCDDEYRSCYHLCGGRVAGHSCGGHACSSSSTAALANNTQPAALEPREATS